MSEKLQDDFIGNEWPSSPVDGDEIEHLVFNGVPLASARRVVRDMDYEPRSSGKLLQAVLPELVLGSITGTAITEQQDVCRLGVVLAARRVPPVGERGHGKLGGVPDDRGIG